MARTPNNPMRFDEDDDPRLAEIERGLKRMAEARELERPESWVIEPIPVLPFPRRGEFFLQIGVWAFIAKTGLFWFIEDFGRTAVNEAIASDALFGGIAIVMLYQYVRVDWIVNQWLVFARGILIILGLITAVHILSGGGVWEGHMKPTAAPTTLLACGVAVLALLLAASTYCVYALHKTQKFLDHPLRFTQAAKEYFHDKG